MDNMENARDYIKDTYELETLKEIANHGCSSGVCSKHIYYGDTNRFYDQYEDEIVEYIESEYGTEFLVELFEKADASLTHYKNDVCWTFIEMIAMEAVEEHNYEYAMSYA